MKIRTGLLLISMVFVMQGQASVTFKVETLTAPKTLLPQVQDSDVFKKILDAKLLTNDYRTQGQTIEYNIVSQNKFTASLVNFGQHSFFEGMYKAYSDHRPFVLSPDMIWLLLSQGFSQHVNNNAEALRHYFVKHNGKMILQVVSNTVSLDNPDSPWETVFPEFTKQIDSFVGQDLVSTLTCNFTTTTPITRVASQITIMEAMQAYFEYYLVSISCGIPEITLEGSSEDWQKIIEKAKVLRTYDLSWWIDPLLPVLVKIKETADGKIDTNFWRSMFAKPDPNNKAGCGTPSKIDGWIVNFYPYNKEGQRNNLKVLNGSSNLPMELACVDLEYIEKNAFGQVVQTVPLELWAGFVGLNQNKSDFTLKPEIGWMVRRKDLNDELSLKALEKAINAGSTNFKIGVRSLSSDLISKLLDVQRKSANAPSGSRLGGASSNAPDMTITFFNKIEIPDEFFNVRFNRLCLNGAIDVLQIEKLIIAMKNVKELYINGNKYIGQPAKPNFYPN